MASIIRKKQMMIEIGPDLARFEGEPGDGNESITMFTSLLESALTNVGRHHRWDVLKWILIRKTKIA